MGRGTAASLPLSPGARGDKARSRVGDAECRDSVWQPRKMVFPLLCFPQLLLLPLRSCLLTGALFSHCSIPGRCHYQPLTPPCAWVMKTLSAAAAASGPCSSSLLHCFLQRVHPPSCPPALCGVTVAPLLGVNNPPPPPDTPRVGRAGPSWGSLTPQPQSQELCRQCLHSTGHCFVWMAQLLG